MVELRSEKIGTVQAQEVTAEFNRLYKAMKADIVAGYEITLTTLGNGKKFTIKKIDGTSSVSCVTCTMVADRFTNSLYLGV